MNALTLAPIVTAVALGASSAWGATALGSELASFAVLGGSDVTSANVSTIGGNLGSSPTAPTAPASQFIFTAGSYQPGTQSAAQTQLTSARVAIGSSPAGPSSLNGTFAPGTYNFGAGLLGAAQTLVLDGNGFNNAMWVFRFASTLTTVQGSSFSIVNIGNGANVGLYWNVGSSATLDGDTFAGNVLALTSITSNGNLTMNCGRLLAQNGNVTLDGVGATISTSCGSAGVPGFGSNGFDQGVVVAAIPTPGAFLLLGSGLAGLLFFRKRPIAVGERRGA